MSEDNEKGAGRRRSIKPLGRLLPYLARYKGLVVKALIFLTLAAATTLVLPLAVRRMIDHGFSQSDAGFINNYFAMLVGLALVLAFASAMRYYYVITIGERIVADLRRDVYAHVMTLSPSFFDVNQSGEIVSRLTADTTQVKSAVGASASLALRNSILCLGAVGMMVYTSPRLSAVVLIAIPLIVFPLIAFGRSVRRRSRSAQDTLANASVLCQRIDWRRAHRAGLQRRTGSRLAAMRMPSNMPMRLRAPPSARARSSPALPSAWSLAALSACFGLARMPFWPAR